MSVAEAEWVSGRVGDVDLTAFDRPFNHSPTRPLTPFLLLALINVIDDAGFVVCKKKPFAKSENVARTTVDDSVL